MLKPSTSQAYDDRHLDCQFAMEDRFIELMEAAEAAGWTADDATAAVIDLADNYVLKLLANDQILQQLTVSRSAR
jgi:hypothetical protein